MNKIISSVVGLAIASVHVAPSTAAQLAEIHPENFRSSPHSTLASTIKHLGVKIIDGSRSDIRECEPKQNSVTYGFYSPSVNAMVLCTGNGSLLTMQKTLVHEAMHMVQDCRAGLTNTHLADKHGYLTKLQYMSLSNAHKSNIQSFYQGSGKIFEVEARRLENSPSVVWKYLIQHCK